MWLALTACKQPQVPMDKEECNHHNAGFEYYKVWLFADNIILYNRFFRQTTGLLSDPREMLFGVNAYNHNAYPGTAKNLARLTRHTGTFAYGWMITRAVGMELLDFDIWPGSFNVRFKVLLSNLFIIKLKFPPHKSLKLPVQRIVYYPGCGDGAPWLRSYAVAQGGALAPSWNFKLIIIIVYKCNMYYL